MTLSNKVLKIKGLETLELAPDWGRRIRVVIVHLIALLAVLPQNTNESAVIVFLFLHWVTACLGITLGWHRLLTHRSFQAPKWLEYFFAICGALALQGGVIEWVGKHRLHHQYSDKSYSEKGYFDPHNSRKGFWWSHLFWSLFQSPTMELVPKVTKDLAADPFYPLLQKHRIWPQLGLGLALWSIGGWPWVIWGIFVRLIAVYHCTWFVNSFSHMLGYRTYETSDSSTNCWWVALLTYGEGWHNNHHAFQYSARHGLKWWEIDLTWWIISLLQKVGLATNVRLVEPTKVR